MVGGARGGTAPGAGSAAAGAGAPGDDAPRAGGGPGAAAGPVGEGEGGPAARPCSSRARRGSGRAGWWTRSCRVSRRGRARALRLVPPDRAGWARSRTRSWGSSAPRTSPRPCGRTCRPTPTLVPPFAALLRNEAPPEGSRSLQGDALHAVGPPDAGPGGEKPLLWVVEDLHFASPTTGSSCSSLARAVEGHRVLLLLTTRPGRIPAASGALRAVRPFRRTSLGRLSAREVVRLLRDAFRNERLAEKLGLRIAEKSDGIPFFVFEMIRGLKEGQFITQLPDGSWVESKVIDEIEVPSAVKDLIGGPAGDLDAEERDVLDVGAVLGYEFEPGPRGGGAGAAADRGAPGLAQVERRPRGRARGRSPVPLRPPPDPGGVYGALPSAARGVPRAPRRGLEPAGRRKEPKDADGALAVEIAEHSLAAGRGPRPPLDPPRAGPAGAGVPRRRRAVQSVRPGPGQPGADRREGTSEGAAAAA